METIENCATSSFDHFSVCVSAYFLNFFLLFVQTFLLKTSRRSCLNELLIKCSNKSHDETPHRLKFHCQETP